MGRKRRRRRARGVQFPPPGPNNGPRPGPGGPLPRSGVANVNVPPPVQFPPPGPNGPPRPGPGGPPNNGPRPGPGGPPNGPRPGPGGPPNGPRPGPGSIRSGLGKLNASPFNPSAHGGWPLLGQPPHTFAPPHIIPGGPHSFSAMANVNTSSLRPPPPPAVRMRLVTPLSRDRGLQSVVSSGARVALLCHHVTAATPPTLSQFVSVSWQDSHKGAFRATQLASPLLALGNVIHSQTVASQIDVLRSEEQRRELGKPLGGVSWTWPHLPLNSSVAVVGGGALLYCSVPEHDSMWPIVSRVAERLEDSVTASDDAQSHGEQKKSNRSAKSVPTLISSHPQDEEECAGRPTQRHSPVGLPLSVKAIDGGAGLEFGVAQRIGGWPIGDYSLSVHVVCEGTTAQGLLILDHLCIRVTLSIVQDATITRVITADTAKRSTSFQPMLRRARWYMYQGDTDRLFVSYSRKDLVERAWRAFHGASGVNQPPAVYPLPLVLRCCAMIALDLPLYTRVRLGSRHSAALMRIARMQLIHSRSQDCIHHYHHHHRHQVGYWEECELFDYDLRAAVMQGGCVQNTPSALSLSGKALAAHRQKHGESVHRFPRLTLARDLAWVLHAVTLRAADDVLHGQIRWENPIVAAARVVTVYARQCRALHKLGFDRVVDMVDALCGVSEVHMLRPGFTFQVRAVRRMQSLLGYSGAKVSCEHVPMTDRSHGYRQGVYPAVCAAWEWMVRFASRVLKQASASITNSNNNNNNNNNNDFNYHYNNYQKHKTNPAPQNMATDPTMLRAGVVVVATLCVVWKRVFVALCDLDVDMMLDVLMRRRQVRKAFFPDVEDTAAYLSSATQQQQQDTNGQWYNGVQHNISAGTHPSKSSAFSQADLAVSLGCPAHLQPGRALWAWPFVRQLLFSTVSRWCPAQFQRLILHCVCALEPWFEKHDAVFPSAVSEFPWLLPNVWPCSRLCSKSVADDAAVTVDDTPSASQEAKTASVSWQKKKQALPSATPAHTATSSPAAAADKDVTQRLSLRSSSKALGEEEAPYSSNTCLASQESTKASNPALEDLEAPPPAELSRLRVCAERSRSVSLQEAVADAIETTQRHHSLDFAFRGDHLQHVLPDANVPDLTVPDLDEVVSRIVAPESRLQVSATVRTLHDWYLGLALEVQYLRSEVRGLDMYNAQMTVHSHDTQKAFFLGVTAVDLRLRRAMTPFLATFSVAVPGVDERRPALSVGDPVAFRVCNPAHGVPGHMNCGILLVTQVRAGHVYLVLDLRGVHMVAHEIDRFQGLAWQKSMTDGVDLRFPWQSPGLWRLQSAVRGVMFGTLSSGGKTASHCDFSGFLAPPGAVRPPSPPMLKSSSSHSPRHHLPTRGTGAVKMHAACSGTPPPDTQRGCGAVCVSAAVSQLEWFHPTHCFDEMQELAIRAVLSATQRPDTDEVGGGGASAGGSGGGGGSGSGKVGGGKVGGGGETGRALVICGPPGTGKTNAMVESVLQVLCRAFTKQPSNTPTANTPTSATSGLPRASLHPHNNKRAQTPWTCDREGGQYRVLVLAPSDYAADVFAERAARRVSDDNRSLMGAGQRLVRAPEGRRVLLRVSAPTRHTAISVPLLPYSMFEAHQPGLRGAVGTALSKWVEAERQRRGSTAPEFYDTVCRFKEGLSFVRSEHRTLEHGERDALSRARQRIIASVCAWMATHPTMGPSLVAQLSATRGTEGVLRSSVLPPLAEAKTSPTNALPAVMTEQGGALLPTLNLQRDWDGKWDDRVLPMTAEQLMALPTTTTAEQGGNWSRLNRRGWGGKPAHIPASSTASAPAQPVLAVGRDVVQEWNYLHRQAHAPRPGLVQTTDHPPFALPTAVDVDRYALTVCSTLTASKLSHTLQGRFDAVFVDESCQATSAELCVAASLLRPGGALVLAGDPYQLGPTVHSPVACALGLDRSLQEQLQEWSLYGPEAGDALVRSAVRTASAYCGRHPSNNVGPNNSRPSASVGATQRNIPAQHNNPQPSASPVIDSSRCSALRIDPAGLSVLRAVHLRTSFRASPSLVRFPSALFYQGRLRCARQTASYLTRWPGVAPTYTPTGESAGFRVMGCVGRSQYDGQRMSISNQAEADLVRVVIQGLLEWSEDPRNRRTQPPVGSDGGSGGGGGSGSGGNGGGSGGNGSGNNGRGGSGGIGGSTHSVVTKDKPTPTAESKLTHTSKDISHDGTLEVLVPAEIGVVTPFRSQVILIRQTLRRCGLGKVRVGVIEDFQGQESRVTIVSTCVSRSDDLYKFLGQSMWDGDGAVAGAGQTKRDGSGAADSGDESKNNNNYDNHSNNNNSSSNNNNNNNNNSNNSQSDKNNNNDNNNKSNENNNDDNSAGSPVGSTFIGSPQHSRGSAVADARQINVALSRAKELTVTIGNPYMLSRLPVWREALVYAKSVGGYAGVAFPAALDGYKNLSQMLAGEAKFSYMRTSGRGQRTSQQGGSRSAVGGDICVGSDGGGAGCASSSNSGPTNNSHHNNDKSINDTNNNHSGDDNPKPKDTKNEESKNKTGTNEENGAARSVVRTAWAEPVQRTLWNVFDVSPGSNASSLTSQQEQSKREKRVRDWLDWLRSKEFMGGVGGGVSGGDAGSGQSVVCDVSDDLDFDGFVHTASARAPFRQYK